MRVWTSTLTGRRVETAAGTFDLTDLLFDAEARRVRYATLDTGGWLSRSEAMIALSRLSAVAPQDNPWSAELTPSELSEAPRITESNSGLNLSDWPPLIVGPFGTAQSPVLLAAQLFGAGGENGRLPPRLSRLSAWDKAPIFGIEGEIGFLEDLLIELPEGTIRAASLRHGESTSEFPATTLRSFVHHDGDPYVVTDLNEAALASGRIPANSTTDAPPDQGWVKAPRG